LTDNNCECLVKIHIELNDELVGFTGESVWAKPLGGDLYEIRNSLWHSCDINWGDVVRAVAQREDLKPEFIEVGRRSGHRTIHLLFLQDCSSMKKSHVLGSLKRWKASYENSDGCLYAVDVPPEGDFDGLCGFLDEQEQEEGFSYRTVVLPWSEVEPTQN
jgi:hypothetical protein